MATLHAPDDLLKRLRAIMRAVHSLTAVMRDARVSERAMTRAVRPRT